LTAPSTQKRKPSEKISVTVPAMDTLLLNRDGWDLCIDASGNIARASDTYSMIQDVASAARLFLGELYYGPPTRGIPYFTEAFGRQFPTPLLKARLVEAAKTVPGVISARCFLTSAGERAITGQIQVETAAGTLVVPL
jgi:hypothetical protein